MIGMIGGFWFLFLRPVELDCNLSLCATKLDRYEESNQVLQITGVDWYEPEAKVVEKVRQLVGSSPTVAVKRLPRSPRKRDVGKLNGGSFQGISTAAIISMASTMGLGTQRRI